MEKTQKYVRQIILALSGALIAVAALAAPAAATGTSTMYFKAPSSLLVGSTFTVEVLVNTNGAQVNAVQADFTYPTNLLSFKSIDAAASSAFPVNASSTGGSGMVSIARGTTAAGGISGILKVANVTFSVKAAGTVNLIFQSSSQLADFTTHLDDLGSKTNAKFSDTATLEAGKTMGSNTRLVTSNGYRAVMQSDGNFVEYNSSGRVLWASNTPRHSGARLVMQSDGNLVIYTTTNKPIWSSKTTNRPGSRLVLQTDGNLVIRNPSNKPLWSREAGRLY